MSGAGWADDTVLMPVPLGLAAQVSEFIAALKAGHADLAQHGTAAGGSGDVVHVTGQGDWTQPMLNDLADNIPYSGVLALLDRCAEAPGRWVLKAEVEGAMGITPVQLRNELGALSKLTKRLFESVIWPMQYKKEQGSYYYRMDDPVAQWWRTIRESA